MAEIENKTTAKRSKKFAPKKRNTRVDLTPMVDLGFLLITFFVFTTTMATPTVMRVNMPFDKVPPGDDICESCVLTVFLTAENGIIYYEGLPKGNTIPGHTAFGKGIRDIILQKRKEVQKTRGTADEFVLIIKPADESSFQNFVDLLDETTINSVKRYYMSEVEEDDRRFLLAQAK